MKSILYGLSPAKMRHAGVSLQSQFCHLDSSPGWQGPSQGAFAERTNPASCRGFPETILPVCYGKSVAAFFRPQVRVYSCRRDH